MSKRSTAILATCTVGIVLSLALLLTPLRTMAMAAFVTKQATTQPLTILDPAYPDDTVRVVGFGYTTGETVTLSFDGQQVGTTTAVQAVGIAGSTEGRISAPITIPDAATVGSHTISAVGQTSGATLQGSVNVQANWRQIGFSSAGGRYNLNETAISPANVGTLTLDWKWTAASMYALNGNSPSIVRGVLYFGTGDNTFHAFAATTGADVWDVYIPANFNGQPAVSDNAVYATGYDLYALNPATGALMWDSYNSASPKLFSTPPTLANGVIYAGSLSNIFAFNAAGCGKPHCLPLWSTPNNGQTMTPSPVVANGRLYAVSGQGTLFVYDAATGKQLWSAVTTLNSAPRMPIVSGGVVYIASADNNLYAFNANGCGAATCSPLWKGTTGGPLNSTPALANGVVYVGSDDHNLYAFNANGCGAATCSPLWTAPTGDMVRSAPAVANGVVYVGSNDNKMYAFAAAGCGAATCSPLWSYTTGGAIGSPVVVNGILYFASQDNTLYAFHLPGTSLVCTRIRCTGISRQPRKHRAP